MNQAEKTEWLNALRSGEYEQGRRYLENDGKFCCLGVKCKLDVDAGRYGLVRQPRIGHEGVFSYGIVPDILQYGEHRSDYLAPGSPTAETFQKWGMTQVQIDTLIEMNDGMAGSLNPEPGKRWTFAEIADWIDENIPAAV